MRFSEAVIMIWFTIYANLSFYDAFTSIIDFYV